MRNPKKQKQTKAPQTFNELLLTAIETEEQGERYRTGERAFQYYLNAISLYEKVNAIKPEPNTFYNIARVYYILAEFESPEPTCIEIHEYLLQAIKNFRIVLAYQESSNIDTMFNLAQVLKTLAGFYYDNCSKLKPKFTIESLFTESNALFESVFNLQSAQLELQSQVAVNLEGLAIANSSLVTKSNDCENQEDGDEEILETFPITTQSLLDTALEHSMLYSEAITRTVDYKHMVMLFEKGELIIQLAKSILIGEQREQQIEIIIHHVALLTSMADTLFEYLQSCSCNDITRFEFQTIHNMYLKAFQLLEPVMSPAVEPILCELGDLQCSFAEFKLFCHTVSKLDYYFTEAATLYEQAFNTYMSALKVNAFNKKIRIALGDIQMLRLKFYPQDHVKESLAKSSSGFYLQGLSNIIKSNAALTKQDLVHMIRLSKSYSWIPALKDEQLQLMDKIKRDSNKYFPDIELVDDLNIEFKY